jgi:hypothetical protein
MVKQTRRWATDREEWGRQEGTGEVKIKGVSICNSWGRPVERIWPKDKLRVKVFFEVKEEIDNYHFGVAVFREDGVYCFGPNTKFAGLALKKMGKGRGSFEVGFKELLLMAGTYYISVAVWDEHETLPYDYHRCNYKIEIGGDNLYGQLLCLPYSWANSTVERKFRFPIKIDGYPNVDFLVDKWEDELKNDSAKLKSVRCLDNYGAEDGAFISGRDMKIKVDFEVSPDFSAKLMLWLGIYRSDGIYCQGQAKDIASCGPNSEILILPKLRLLPGGYRVSAGIWDKNNNRFLGYTHGLYSFNMVSDRMDHGTIYLEHSWRCNIPEAKEGR